MGTDSLSTTFGIGKQSAFNTAATAFKGLRLTNATATPVPTIEQTDDEFGGGAGLVATDGGHRLGIVSRLAAQGRVRPQYWPLILAWAGLGEIATTGAGPYTHVNTRSLTHATLPWFSVHVTHGAGANELDRVIRDTRLMTLTIRAEANALLKMEMTGMGIHEQIAAGTETDVNEAGLPFNTVQGAISLVDTGASELVGSIRNLTIVIELELATENDAMVIANHEMEDMLILGMKVNGSADAAFSKQAFLDFYYGGVGTAAAGYSFEQLEGALDVTFQTASNITGEVVPYSTQIEIPHLIVNAQEFSASGRSEIRLPIAFTAFDDGVDEMITVTTVNDIASY